MDHKQGEISLLIRHALLASESRGARLTADGPASVSTKKSYMFM